MTGATTRLAQLRRRLQPKLDLAVTAEAEQRVRGERKAPSLFAATEETELGIAYHHDLFTAHQAISLVPIAGLDMFDAFVRASVAASPAVILSFSGLRDLNAGGVGMLMTLLVRANREGRRLLACGLTGRLRVNFAAARLDEAISVYASEDDALVAAAAV